MTPNYSSIIFLVLIISSATKTVNAALYYILEDDNNGAQQLFRFDVDHNLHLAVGLMPGLPCKSMIPVPIWDCNVAMIKSTKDCRQTAIINLPNLGPIVDVVVLDASPNIDLVNPATAVVANTLFLCGWIMSNDKIMCEQISKETMKFEPISSCFHLRRQSFHMTAFGSQLCVFGGYKVGTDQRTRQVECVEVAAANELNFIGVPKPICYHGELSTLLVGNNVLLCGDVSSHDCPNPPICEWLTLDDKSKIVHNSGWLETNSLINNIPTHVKVVLIKTTGMVMLFYDTTENITAVMSFKIPSYVNKSQELVVDQMKPIRHRSNMVKPFSVSDKCQKTTKSYSRWSSKFPITSSMSPREENPEKMDKPHERSPKTNEQDEEEWTAIFAVIVTITVVAILLLIGVTYKRKTVSVQEPLSEPHSSSQSYSYTRDDDEPNESPGIQSAQVSNDSTTSSPDDGHEYDSCTVKTPNLGSETVNIVDMLSSSGKSTGTTSNSTSPVLPDERNQGSATTVENKVGSMKLFERIMKKPKKSPFGQIKDFDI